MREVELDLVAQNGSVGHVFADDPVLGSVQQLIGIVRQIVRVEGRRIASGEAKAHAADVDGLRLDDLDHPRLPWVDGPRRQDVAVAELGVVADGRPAVGSHANVDAVSARMKRERLEGRVAVVAQRRRWRKVLEDGRRRRLLWRSRRRDGRQREGRDLLRATVEVERIHRDEQVGLAPRAWHVMVDGLRLPVVIHRGDQGGHALAGCARLEAGGAPACR